MKCMTELDRLQSELAECLAYRKRLREMTARSREEARRHRVRATAYYSPENDERIASLRRDIRRLNQQEALADSREMTAIGLFSILLGLLGLVALYLAFIYQV